MSKYSLSMMLFIFNNCYGLDLEHYRSLVSDRKPYTVGDTVTVIVAESTNAESMAGTGAQSNTGISGSAYGSSNSYKSGFGIQGDNKETGQTTRKGLIKTNIAVQVKEVLPNDSLAIEGEQMIVVNDEKQHIRVSGIIRSNDISYENTVMSYRLANAKIEVIGKGVINDAQKQNIIYRTLRWLRIL